MQVREDGITLYGFLDPADRVWFRLLQTVQGVGARVALSLLGTLRPHELATRSPPATRRRWPGPAGVGARLAARIVAELKDRVGGLPAGRGRGAPRSRLRPARRRPRTRSRPWSTSATAASRRLRRPGPGRRPGWARTPPSTQLIREGLKELAA